MKKSLLALSALSLVVISCNNSANKTAATDSTKAAPKVQPGSPIVFDTSKRYIFLTFDDGPQPPGTRLVEDAVQSTGIKASFFMVGMHAFDRQRKYLVQRAREGYPQMLLCTHSYSHGFQNKYDKFYRMTDSAAADMERANAELQAPLKIVRFPGRNTWIGKDGVSGQKSADKVADILAAKGYSAFGWDVEWMEKGKFPQQSATEMVQKVNDAFENFTTNVERTIVILTHDRLFGTPQYRDSLVKFITTLKQNPKYVFETVDHYPNLAGAVQAPKPAAAAPAKK